jgi:hypothetical protein
MMMQILTMCLTVAPIFLFIMGIFGFLGILQVGPRELPKTHIINRKTGFTFLLLALGIFLLANSDQALFITGLVLSIIALGFYGYFYREARKQFPEMSPEEWFKHLKTRYKFMNDTDQPKPKEKKGE